MIAKERRISARVLPPWQAWAGSVSFTYQNATQRNLETNRAVPADLCCWSTPAHGSSYVTGGITLRTAQQQADRVLRAGAKCAIAGMADSASGVVLSQRDPLTSNSQRFLQVCLLLNGQAHRHLSDALVGDVVDGVGNGGSYADDRGFAGACGGHVAIVDQMHVELGQISETRRGVIGEIGTLDLTVLEKNFLPSAQRRDSS